MSEGNCTQCGEPLSRNEIGLHKRLIDRGATAFLCRQCQAARFSCDPARIDGQIERFRRTGCQLFDPWDDTYAPDSRRAEAAQTLEQAGILKNGRLCTPLSETRTALLAEVLAEGLYALFGPRVTALADGEGLPDGLAARVWDCFTARYPSASEPRTVTLYFADGPDGALSLSGRPGSHYAVIWQQSEE